MERQSIEIARRADNVYVKLPITETKKNVIKCRSPLTITVKQIKIAFNFNFSQIRIQKLLTELEELIEFLRDGNDITLTALFF